MNFIIVLIIFVLIVWGAFLMGIEMKKETIASYRALSQEEKVKVNKKLNRLFLEGFLMFTFGIGMIVARMLS